MEDLKSIKECPDCASMNVLYSKIRDQVICRDCGLIFEPLVPELETRFERTHGLKLNQSKNLGRPSKLEKSIKKPKAVKNAKVKQKVKSKLKAKPKAVKNAKVKQKVKSKSAKKEPKVAAKPEQKKRKGFFWRR